MAKAQSIPELIEQMTGSIVTQSKKAAFEQAVDEVCDSVLQCMREERCNVETAIVKVREHLSGLLADDFGMNVSSINPARVEAARQSTAAVAEHGFEQARETVRVAFVLVELDSLPNGF